jgi:hypothetical protein
LNYFLGLMNNGTNIQTIQAIIAGSDEYYVVRGGGTDTGFLNALYGDFLNRAIDTTAQQTALASLANGQSRTQIVMQLIGTGEFVADLIQWDYQTYLHRAADLTSLNAFIASLMGGRSDNDIVVATLLGSGEYMP